MTNLFYCYFPQFYFYATKLISLAKPANLEMWFLILSTCFLESVCIGYYKISGVDHNNNLELHVTVCESNPSVFLGFTESPDLKET